MTLIALTDCCRRLAIDRKTLHRWLAQAELGVQAHPADARCKGLTREQLLAGEPFAALIIVTWRTCQRRRLHPRPW